MPSTKALALLTRRFHLLPLSRFTGAGGSVGFLSFSPPSSMALNIHAIYGLIFKVWRKKRFEMFLRRMSPLKTEVLLDVGGYPAFWISNPQPVARIDSLNIDKAEWDPARAPDYNIQTLVGDGTHLEMVDNSYDIAFSNSVIEHVGTWEQQQAFASEIRRVAKRIWVQTPAYECPFEPHYMTPFVHYLPREVQRRTLRWLTVWGWIQRPPQTEIDMMVDTTRLITRREMGVLFPDCEIVTERMLGFLPKSYIAIRGGASGQEK